MRITRPEQYAVGVFQTTLWTRIADAGRGDPAALEAVVGQYREPVSRYLRARGHTAEDAEDLTQEVLLRLCSHEVLAHADRTRGRFRSFLLGVARNVERDVAKHDHALRRGGGLNRARLSEVGEVAAADDPAEAEFDRAWGDHVLRRALAALEQENPRQHRTMTLRFEKGLAYQQIADELGRNLQQVKNDIHRARRQLVELVKAELGNHCSSEEEYQDELASFLKFLGER